MCLILPRPARRPALFVLSLLPLLAFAAPAAAQPELDFEEVVTGLQEPLGIVHAGDGSDRLFVVEKVGSVRVVTAGRAVLPEPFLDLRGQVSLGNEQGLLGLAFHPRFGAPGAQADRRVFVYFTEPTGDSRLVSYRVPPETPNRVDPQSVVELLAVSQPFANHNGGQLAFGPDGFLYLGLGDGGGGGDPMGNAQNLRTLLGKIVRLDVDRTGDATPYAIPPGNPTFPGVDGARREIWAYGLRNPWRFSFDRATGDLFVGDVGQARREEIDLLPAGVGGLNLGWDRLEGSLCNEPFTGCDPSGTTLPILEYSHDEGCSVTGGYRYRGDDIPALAGTYLFGDFCRGTVWGGTQEADGGWTRSRLLRTDLTLSAFGEDEAGEIHVADFGAGRLLRLVDRNAPPPGTPPGEPLTTAAFPDFRFFVRITNQQGEEQPVRAERECVPETLCVSGAIPGRSELFVRIVGPKPNGRLWPNLVRFSTSKIEVWIEQLSTGAVKMYTLEGASPGSSELDGLFDREGFSP